MTSYSNFKINPKKSLVGILVMSTLAFIIVKCEVSEEDTLKLYNEIRKVIPINKNDFLKEFDEQLNRKIIQNPNLLDYKIRSEVNDAIWNYERKEKTNRKINMKNEVILKEIEKTKYTKVQKLNIENAVYYEFADGTMGIRGAWVPSDPREIPLE